MEIFNTVISLALTISTLVIVLELSRIWVCKQELELLNKPLVKYGLLILGGLLFLPMLPWP